MQTKIYVVTTYNMKPVMSILHDDSIQFNSIEFEDWSDSRVHKVPPICMLGIVYNNFQQPDPRCLAPLKLDTVSRI